VIGAMAGEIKPLIELLGARKTRNGDWSKGNIKICHSGVAKVNAAITAQRAIDTYKPKFILNIGISGALDPSLKIGEIVVCGAFSYHDVAPDEIFANHPTLGGERKADEKLAEKALAACKTLGFLYRTGKAVSGDQIIFDANHAKKLFEKGGTVVDMESGALSHTCLVNQVPFCAVRAVSDFADENALSEMERQEHILAVKLARVAMEMLYESRITIK